jgi:hypothetical protein
MLLLGAPQLGLPGDHLVAQSGLAGGHRSDQRRPGVAQSVHAYQTLELSFEFFHCRTPHGCRTTTKDWVSTQIEPDRPPPAGAHEMIRDWRAGINRPRVRAHTRTGADCVANISPCTGGTIETSCVRATTLCAASCCISAKTSYRPAKTSGPYR